MKVKNNVFISYYDFSQMLYSIILSICILVLKINIQTLLLVVVIVSYGFFDAFGRRLIISNNKIKYRFLIFKSNYNLEEINYAKFNSVLYGHATLFLYTKKRKLVGYFRHEDKIKLKYFLDNSKISNNL